jgi:hypothetical protein
MKRVLHATALAAHTAISLGVTPLRRSQIDQALYLTLVTNACVLGTTTYLAHAPGADEHG